jgi:hypothetical protein
MSLKISVAVMRVRMEQTLDENGQPVTFTIDFFNSKGQRRRMRAQNHVKHGSIGGGKNPKSNFRYSLKQTGTVLLFDLDKNDYRSVKISRIAFFNDMEVIH